jgi:hypothetical protein
MLKLVRHIREQNINLLSCQMMLSLEYNKEFPVLYYSQQMLHYVQHDKTILTQHYHLSVSPEKIKKTGTANVAGRVPQ